jgi:hypothetical protein
VYYSNVVGIETEAVLMAISASMKQKENLHTSLNIIVTLLKNIIFPTKTKVLFFRDDSFSFLFS